MMGLYFIGILLPASLEERILSFKQDFAKNYFAPYALKSPGHITMAETFRTNPLEIGKLQPKLTEFFSQFPAFTGEIRNFGNFPKHRPTVFAALGNPVPFQEIRKELFWERKNAALLNKKAIPSSQLTPHITVAYRDLSEDNFHKAWEKYSKLEFCEDFMVESIHLLQHKGRWQSICEFPLRGLSRRRSGQLPLFGGEND